MRTGYKGYTGFIISRRGRVSWQELFPLPTYILHTRYVEPLGLTELVVIVVEVVELGPFLGALVLYFS